jgi:hypothetical protein
MIARLGRCALPLLLVLGLGGCFGPKPAVVSHELHPPDTPGGPYTMLVTIRNTGGGKGQAEVQARLIVAATGETAAEADQTVDLQPHETVHLLLPLQPSLPGPYNDRVEAQYPH